MTRSNLVSAMISSCIVIGVFTAIAGMHAWIFGMGVPLQENVAFRVPPAAVMQFAAEGRAQLKDMKLATGRSAIETVGALSEALSKDQASLSFRVIDDNGWHVEGTANIVRAIMVIPHESRGRLNIIHETHDPEILKSVHHATEFLSAVVAREWLPTSPIRVHALRPGETRAYANGLGGQASIHLRPGAVDVSTAIHELAHHIEGDHPGILELSKRFIARRARGGSPESLQILTGQNYEPHEITLRANWSTRGGHHYTGKFYGPSLKRATATEVISMGLERLYREPDTFYREDSDYFLFLLLALQCT